MTTSTTATQPTAPTEQHAQVPAPTHTTHTHKPCAHFLQLVPFDFARRHLVLGVEPPNASPDAPKTLLLVSSSTPSAAIHNTAWKMRRHADAVRAENDETLAAQIDAAYERHRADAALARNHTHTDDHPANSEPPQDDAARASETIDRLLVDADRDLLSVEGKAPVVRLVDALLFEALARRASDVHIQPIDGRTLVRYRVDGTLITVRELSKETTPAVISRIKVMGQMDIAERRVPQDGRATVTVGGDNTAKRPVDLRISSLPTSYGERVVVRILDNRHGEAMQNFSMLGMPDVVEKRFLAQATRASGIVLVTGPTGSGKTTTLYTTLRWLACRADASGALNIMTIEDPIEYELSIPGVAISQAQVNTRKGVSFASGLRHILRQDPDVVMVGEVRDAETARIAIQASLTGHLVFSTLHTTDAPGAVTRLVDLGVEPYLVGASLSAVLAQRLVRRVHAECRGAGCPACFNTGLRGRIGLFELLVVDDAIRALVEQRAASTHLRSAARASGMTVLADEGRRLVDNGLTTAAEVRRVAGEPEQADDHHDTTPHTTKPGPPDADA